MKESTKDKLWMIVSWIVIGFIAILVINTYMHPTQGDDDPNEWGMDSASVG